MQHSSLAMAILLTSHHRPSLLPWQVFAICTIRMAIAQDIASATQAKEGYLLHAQSKHAEHLKQLKGMVAAKK